MRDSCGKGWDGVNASCSGNGIRGFFVFGRVTDRECLGEKDLRDRVKAVGGRWDPEAKLWNVAYGSSRGSDLEERIMKDFIKEKRRK